MAKSVKRKGVKKATGRKATAKSIGENSGPITLAEAEALVQAKQPKSARPALRKSAVPPGSPVALGAERGKLKKEQRDEIARRVREYTAVMKLMKKRGARRPKPKGAGKAKGKGSVAKPGPFVPLQIFAEGDSWFDYPVPFFGGGIIPRLKTRLGVPILNLAKAGDEVRYMLGVAERIELAKHLTNGNPAGGPWDVLLFSGGGNDIVDNPMALWIKDWNPALPPVSHIHQQRFDCALALVRAGYEDLITLRNRLSPTTRLVFHDYDFAIPDGRGICGYGPWLKPTFDLHKFPTLSARQAVVKAMLQQFAAMLTTLAAQPSITFINTQGTLAPLTSSWHNELHPARAGFDRFADIFYQQLKTLYPNRVV
jgi:hypothetical protein